MPEIKSKHSHEHIAQYARDNQLDVLNYMQIAAKFMELDVRISELEDTISKLTITQNV